MPTSWKVSNLIRSAGVDSELFGDLADRDAGTLIDDAQDVLLSADSAGTGPLFVRRSLRRARRFPRCCPPTSQLHPTDAIRHHGVMPDSATTAG